MPIINPFRKVQKFLQQVRSTTSQEAWEWLSSGLRAIGAPSDNAKGRAAEALTTTAEQQLRNRKIPSHLIGSVVYYWYDPKWKHKLPMFDRFPVGIVVNVKPDGFQLLNLHWLSPGARMTLLKALIEARLKVGPNNQKYLEISYGFLKGAARYKSFAACFRRYLSSHVRSRVTVVDPEDWAKVVLLPSERFQRGGKQLGGTVSKPEAWAWARKKIK